MSRSYRVAVKESLSRVVKAHDKISTDLEMLEILPPEQMSEMLKKELEEKGYEEKDGMMVKEQDGIKVSVDVKTGKVTLSSEDSKSMELEKEKEGRAYDDVGASAAKIRDELSQQAINEMEKEVDCEKSKMELEIANKIEKNLGSIKRDLDNAVNRVTAEALKEKARSMGEIKEITENDQEGSMTIVVEV